MPKRTKTQKAAQREDNVPEMEKKKVNDMIQEEELTSAESVEVARDQDDDDGDEMMLADDTSEDGDTAVLSADKQRDEDLDDELETSPDSEDIEDDSDDTEGEEAKEKKKRGKRQVLFCCSGVKEVNEDGATSLVAFQDEIPVTMPADEDQKLDPIKGRTEVIGIFETKYGYKPHDIRGPFYNYKGIVIPQRKRETLNQTIAREAPFTTERGIATHRLKDMDWRVIVNFTERPDTVFVFYDALLDPKQAPKDKSKFQKPQPKFLPITSLRDIQKTSTTHT